MESDDDQDENSANATSAANATDEANEESKEEEESKEQPVSKPETEAVKQSRTVSLQDFIPICSGRMLTNGVPGGGNQPPKGKAVEIHHHLFDALWNIGTRQIDASILLR